MERKMVESSDATLELTIISVDTVTCTSAVVRRGWRPSAVAWIDPTHKIPATKTFPQTLHLPLSSPTLHNPNSCLAIQIFFPKLPFPGGGGGGSKLFGSAQVQLSLFPISGGSITLPLISSSGKHRGSIVVRVRVLWCLDSFASPESGAFYSERRCCNGASTEFFTYNEPTAPPEPRDKDSCDEELRNLEMPDNAEPATEEIVNACVDQAKSREKDGALRSFLVGLFGGVIATVLVGISALAE